MQGASCLNRWLQPQTLQGSRLVQDDELGHKTEPELSRFDLYVTNGPPARLATMAAATLLAGRKKSGGGSHSDRAS